MNLCWVRLDCYQSCVTCLHVFSSLFFLLILLLSSYVLLCTFRVVIAFLIMVKRTWVANLAIFQVRFNHVGFIPRGRLRHILCRGSQFHLEEAMFGEAF